MSRLIIIYSRSKELSTLVESIIEGAGVKTICVATHQALYQHCQNQDVRLIIMLDVAPLLNRSVDIKTLRNNPTQQKPKAHHRAIYVITWHQSQHMVLSLLESGIDQYLTFPISALRLRSKVEEFFKNPKTVR